MPVEAWARIAHEWIIQGITRTMEEEMEEEPWDGSSSTDEDYGFYGWDGE